MKREAVDSTSSQVTLLRRMVYRLRSHYNTHLGQMNASQLRQTGRSEQSRQKKAQRQQGQFKAIYSTQYDFAQYKISLIWSYNQWLK